MVHFRGFSWGNLPYPSGVCNFQTQTWHVKQVKDPKSWCSSLFWRSFGFERPLAWTGLQNDQLLNNWMKDHKWGARIVSNSILTEIGVIVTSHFFLNQVLTCGLTQDSSDFKTRCTIIVFIMWNIATLASVAFNEPDSTPNFHLMVRWISEELHGTCSMSKHDDLSSPKDDNNLIYSNLFFLRFQSDRSWGSGTLPFLDMFSYLIFFFEQSTSNHSCQLLTFKKNCMLASESGSSFLGRCFMHPFSLPLRLCCLQSLPFNKALWGAGGTGSMDRWIVLNTS